jgi:small-conductance mechanosensitive channel
MGNGFEQLFASGQQLVRLLPQILGAMGVLALTWLVAKTAQRLVVWATRGRRLRPSLVELLKNLTAIGTWVLGLLLAMTILFPEMSPTDLAAALGVGSIAIGFAFKDVFENFIAGVFVLSREPMRLGDYITCADVEGKVERITIRDTHLRRADGQLTILPNAVLLKSPVEIRTDLEKRRVSLIVGVAYGEDIAQSRRIIHDAVRPLSTVDADRDVDVFANAFSSSSIDFEVTWWTISTPFEVRRSRDEVVTAIKAALDDAGIEIPFPHRTLTFKEPLPIARSIAEADRP